VVLMNESQTAYGTYHQPVSLEGNTAGTYFLRVHVGDAVKVWQITVQ
jgi:hypothetical protein